MRAPRFSRPFRPARAPALLASLAAFALITPAAHAHGGNTVLDGVKSGVTIRVQSSPAQTPSGGPAIDLSTLLNGSGTGKATVDYWVRPSGRKAFKVKTDRDDGGTFHAEISTADRGDAATWALSAIVTLGDGKRLRVTNASSNPPGPDPAATGTSESKPETTSKPAPTTPTLTEGNPDAQRLPTSPATTPAAAGEPIEDISGESDGPPGWVFPSLLVLTVIGLGLRAVMRRKPPQND